MFQEWQSFYILVGTSAATLVGLMFVALSVGSRVIPPKDLPALRVYVSPTVVHFLYVLATSAVVLLPNLPRRVLGILLVFAGLASCVRALIGLRVMRRSHLDAHDWVWYLLVPSVSYLLFIGTGIGLILRVGQADIGLAVTTILLLVAGIRNAWDLVIFRVLPQDEPSRRETRVESPAPGGDAALRQSVALSPSEQGDVARLIEEAGLKSVSFTWALQPSRYAMIGPPVSAVVHTRSGCFFRFEYTKKANGYNRISVFTPSKGAREVTKAAVSWPDQLEQVRDWLVHLAP